MILLLRQFCCFLSFLFLFSFHAHYIKAEEIAVSAASAVVLDSATNAVLYEKNPYTELPMASTTKIMTALLACEYGNPDMTVTVTQDMLLQAEGTSLYLKEGDIITLYDLIKGALIVSGNDCANAIAFAVAGSKEAFVEMMNRRASEIGMRQTVFVTPSGLDENNHHSSAYDMALLSSRAMKNDVFSAIVGAVSTEITVNGAVRTLKNHNKLLRMNDRFIGIKTGYTKKAGRCLVSAYQFENHTIIIVTLNAPDDWNDHLALANAAEKQYNKYENSEQIMLPCVGARQQTVRCTYSYAVYSTSPPWIRLYYYPILYAPLKSGDPVGYAEIICIHSVISTVAITALEEVNYGE